MSVLTLERVTFAYPGGPPVVSDVSLSCGAGESVLLVGDNGSGKSTFGRLIGGLLRPSSGRVVIDGEDLAGVTTRRRPSRTVYVSQVSYLQFFGATIGEELSLAARQAGKAVPEAATVEVFALPSLDTNPRDLSYPQMWRLQMLLLGAIFSPRVLFIDEMVAPALPDQQRVLSYTLDRRRSRGDLTWLAYQRPVGIPFDRELSMAG